MSHDWPCLTRRVGPSPVFIMTNTDVVTRNLASALLAGGWTRPELLKRGKDALGSNPLWLRGLIRRLCKAFSQPPTLDALVAHLNDKIAFFSADIVKDVGDSLLGRVYHIEPGMR